MSLRTRVLLAMGVVAAVLVLSAVAITRATKSNLVEQSDQQLERAQPQMRARRAYAFGPGREPGPPPPGPASALHVAVVDQATGRLDTLYLPETTATPATQPDLPAAEAMHHLGGGPFTVSDTDHDLRYRAIVRSEPTAQR